MSELSQAQEADYPFDLGPYQRPISSPSPLTQTWVNRGLVWMFGFNHEEAITCFEKALAADKDCVIARFGIAHSVGPEYNRQWGDFSDDLKREVIRRVHTELDLAQKSIKEDKASSVEAALVSALRHRYPHDVNEEIQPHLDAFADELRKVYEQFTDDLDVTALFAEALITRTPWQLWNLATGEPEKDASTLEVKDVLETTFKRPEAWGHPGLLHFYIHLMEMSPHPEAALRHGDRLALLFPDVGHLMHMPTHIDVLCGDYYNVVARNTLAVEADHKFAALRTERVFYTLYRCHNLHFKVYGAMFLAQESAAREVADVLITIIPEPLIRKIPDYIEAFVAVKQHALVRFGRWEEIIEQALPEDIELYSATTATMRYARAIAFANMKDIEKAKAERDKFYEAKKAVPKSRLVFNNTVVDVLGVAEKMMEGELAYQEDKFDGAFELLREAIKREEHLKYDEPWGWMQPIRHVLGALLLEQKRYEEAEEVYRIDLGLTSKVPRARHHPKNVWSLHGLHECLIQRGENVELPHIHALLLTAQARADEPVRASCFCRKSARCKCE